MDNHFYLITRDNYLRDGVWGVFTGRCVKKFSLHIIAPQKFFQMIDKGNHGATIYLMADDDVLRHINYCYPFLRRVLIPLNTRPEALPGLLRQEDSRSHRLVQFSECERTVLDLMRCGMNPVDIARAIKRSVKTVSYHKRLIMEKTGCKSHTQLMSLLLRLPAG